MAFVADFNRVRAFLQSRGARRLKETPRGDIYVDRAGQYIKVAKSGSGFDVTVHASRAACGCD